MEFTLQKSVRILHGLKDAVFDLEDVDQLREDIQIVVKRDYFKPDEEERLWAWFSRYLSVREGLWEIIDSVSDNFEADLSLIVSDNDWQQFIVGYSAATLLVRMDHLFIDQIATHSLVQRKFNEANPIYRIPRKQYTRIFRALTNPDNSFLLLRTLRFSQSHRKRLQHFEGNSDVGTFAQLLPSLEKAIDPGILRYLRRWLRYRWHAFRRRGASAKQQSAFLMLEAGGRIVAEINNQQFSKRVDPVVDQIKLMIRPGDIFVTRHDFVASNLFLPGFWPHAALYIGTESDRQAMGIEISPEQASRWQGDKCILEADTEGVLFRSIRKTLAVDAVVIIRPRCSEKELAKAISRVCSHEGKGYNFDFDFTRSDKLVCTEVIYRAYDGIGDIHFTLQERAGRYALSAEDILDLALEGSVFKPVALFGTVGCYQSLCSDDRMDELLARSYR